MRQILIKFFFYFFLFFFKFSYCYSEQFVKEFQFNLLDDYSFSSGKNIYHAIIEIPSGSNEKWEITKDGKKIQREFNNGVPRTINYLGYPANYGFIPQTLVSFDQGGDGDAVDVLVLGQKLEIGSMVKIRIIGMLSLKDGGFIDNKVIGVLHDSNLSSQISSIGDFEKSYPGLLTIVKIWFENYKGYKLETFGFLEKNITKQFIIKANKNYLLKNKF